MRQSAPALATFVLVVCAFAAEGRVPVFFSADAGRYVARSGNFVVALGPGGAVITSGAGAPVHMRFGNAVAPEGLERLPFTSNFFTGRDASSWRTGVPNFGRVRYGSIYPGIDLVYHAADGRLEFDFIVAPGADYRDVRLRFDDPARLRIDRSGDLIVSTPGGELRHHKPVIYEAGSRKAVAGRFVLKSPYEVGFQVARYDRRRTLVIDPVLSYSTYLGGPGADTATAIAVASDGSFYVAGNNASDVFLMHFDRTGTSVLNTVFLAGNASDTVQDMALDANGNIHLAGTTASADFPSFPVNAYRQPTGATEAFAVKLSPTGAMLYSTLLGHGLGYGIAIGPLGNAFITGYAPIEEFPITFGASQTDVRGKGDAFVVELNSEGTDAVYSTRLGGMGADYGRAIAVDTSGQATVVGHVNGSTATNWFPAPPDLVTGKGGSDVFVARLNATGTLLVYGAILGGAADDFGFAVALDAQSNAYITGATTSGDFPVTTSAARRKKAGGFVAKLDGAGALVYSTFIGNDGALKWCTDPTGDRPCGGGFAIALDAYGRAHVAGAISGTGSTDAALFPTAGAIQSTYAGASDAFFLQLDPAGSAVSYSTLLGGGGDDAAQDIAIDTAGAVYIAGTTASANWPLVNAYRSTYGGGAADALVAKVNMSSLACVYTLSESGRSFAAGGGSGTLDVLTQEGCPWMASSPVSWIVVSGATYTVAANTGVARSATLTVAGQSFAVTQSAGACTYTLGPTSASIPAAGGTGTINVTAPAGCPWTASSPVSWITVSGATYTVAANTGVARSATLTVAGQSFAVTQSAGACTYTLGPTSASIPAAGATGTINVTAPAGCPWTASSPVSWITVSGATYTVAANVGAPRSATLSVAGRNFVINQTGIDTTPPFGSFDTPANNATGVTGATPVTGWALDNGEVTSVKIFRDPRPGEPVRSNGLVFIGDAVFVEGSRPDVRVMYPNHVFSSRAGWGLQVLTNMLPNTNGQSGFGNGTYRLHAIAYDAAGNQTVLGIRTITCTNATATKPFGTIDTPAAGETASGTSYLNWGWALTPQPYSMPLDGSTMHVFIDGVPIGNPGYGISRSDIASLFPGYQNTNAAVGVYVLDTTRFTNGVHTIAWSATDTGGRVDGLGSRFFSIDNPTPAVASDLFSTEQPKAARKMRRDGVCLRTGYGTAAPLTALEEDDRGVAIARVRQMDRLELHLPLAGPGLRGCLIAGAECDPLPAGSALDAANGILYWQLSPAFIGTYNFRFDNAPDVVLLSIRVQANDKY